MTIHQEKTNARSHRHRLPIQTWALACKKSHDLSHVPSLPASVSSSENEWQRFVEQRGSDHPMHAKQLENLVCSKPSAIILFKDNTRYPQANSHCNDLQTADSMTEVAFRPKNSAYRQHHLQQKQKPNPSKPIALGKSLNVLITLFWLLQSCLWVSVLDN